MTHDGLKIVEVTHLTLHFGKLHVKHPVLIVNKIAHKLILGNDFLIQYKCDLLNSAKACVFGGEQVPYTLFRSTVKLNLPSYLLDNYHYWTVLGDGTSGSARRERTLRDKSDFLVRTNNFESKPNT